MINPSDRLRMFTVYCDECWYYYYPCQVQLSFRHMTYKHTFTMYVLLVCTEHHIDNSLVFITAIISSDFLKGFT